MRIEDRCNPVQQGGWLRPSPCQQTQSEALRERRQDAYAAHCEADASACRFVLNSLRRELDLARSEASQARFELQQARRKCEGVEPVSLESCLQVGSASNVRSAYGAKPVGALPLNRVEEVVPSDVIRLPTKVHISNLGSLIDILA